MTVEQQCTLNLLQRLGRCLKSNNVWVFAQVVDICIAVVQPQPQTLEHAIKAV